MEIGISAFAWTSEFRSSHLDLLPAMRDLGLKAVEIPKNKPTKLPIDEIRVGFEDNRIDCTVCAILPAGINPISQDKSTRQESLKHLERCVFASAAMGAKLLGGPL